MCQQIQSYSTSLADPLGREYVLHTLGALCALCIYLGLRPPSSPAPTKIIWIKP